jgi:hypothetical protein
LGILIIPVLIVPVSSSFTFVLASSDKKPLVNWRPILTTEELAL